VFCDPFFPPCSVTLKNLYKLAAAGDSAIESRVIIVNYTYISKEDVLSENLLPFISEINWRVL